MMRLLQAGLSCRRTEIDQRATSDNAHLDGGLLCCGNPQSSEAVRNDGVGGEARNTLQQQQAACVLMLRNSQQTGRLPRHHPDDRLSLCQVLTCRVPW